MGTRGTDSVGGGGAGSRVAGAGPDGATGRSWILPVAVLAVVAVGAASMWLVRDRIGNGTAADVPPSSEPSRFEVMDPPEGFTLLRVGAGEGDPPWADDIELPMEGYTLLSEDGTTDGEVDSLAVGYVFIDGGASVNRPPTEIEHHEVDDLMAWYAEGPWGSDLLHPVDHRIAIRVSSGRSRSYEDLTALAEQVPLPANHDPADLGPVETPGPPVLPPDFGGLEPVGAVSPLAASSVIAWHHYEQPLPYGGAMTQLWVGDAGEKIVVRTIAGVEADLDAIGRHPWLDARAVGTREVGGRCAIELECSEESGCRSLVTTTDAGDLIFVSSATYGPDGFVPEDMDVLAAVAASARTVDSNRWREMSIGTFGGPDLRPDPGAEVLAQGEGHEAGPADEWLVQTPPTGAWRTGLGGAQSGGSGEGGVMVWDDGFDSFGLGACIKFGDLSRSCSGLSLAPDRPGHAFAVFRGRQGVDGTVEGASVHSIIVVRGLADDAVGVGISGSAVDLTAELHPTPRGDARWAIVPVDLSTVTCDGSEPGTVRVALLDEDAGDLACLDRSG